MDKLPDNLPDVLTRVMKSEAYDSNRRYLRLRTFITGSSLDQPNYTRQQHGFIYGERIRKDLPSQFTHGRMIAISSAWHMWIQIPV